MIDRGRLRLMITRRRLNGASSGQSFGESRLIFAGGSAASEVEDSFSMEHTAEADLFGFAGDREIHFADAEELEREHPVAEVMKHENEIVMVLECLDLHARPALSNLRATPHGA